MPNGTVKSIASKSGKTVAAVEKIWDEVKAEAKKKFGKEDGHFWSYVNSVTHKKCGLTESTLTFRDFNNLFE
jgi:hypothetical protein